MAGGWAPGARLLVSARSAQADDAAQDVEPRIAVRARGHELDVAQPWKRLLEVPVGLVVRRRRRQVERRPDAHEERRALPDQRCRLLEKCVVAELRPPGW